MKCVILAAGEGKRMHPLTFSRPKVMLPILNIPLIERNIIQLKKAGIKDIIFVVGYKSEMVRNYFGNGKKWDLNIQYINQGIPKGTAHAIGMVEKFVDDFIVLCGDTFFDVEDIKNIISQKNSIGIFIVKNPEGYGIVEIKDDKFVKIHEKTNDFISNIINAGIYHFDKKIFRYINQISKSVRGEYEITDAINLFINENYIKTVQLKTWRDVVYPWDLFDINREILKNIKKNINTTIEKNTTIKGNVSIGTNSVVLNGSYIEGPVLIGENCKIGPNCYIRPFSSIGNGCHIGNACEVKNSIIMNNCRLSHHNYIGDSIIGENCNIGSGTKVANLRFDKNIIDVVLNGKKISTKRKKLGVIIGDNVQTGINSMLNTGSIIGNNCFIGPGSFVSGEIQPNSVIM